MSSLYKESGNQVMFGLCRGKHIQYNSDTVHVTCILLQRIYCSKECQKADWTTHKADCGPFQSPSHLCSPLTLWSIGRTDRIHIEQFYPFLAWLHQKSFAFVHHLSPHPALKAKISNQVKYIVTPVRLRDGSMAQTVSLDDRQAVDPSYHDNLAYWYPLAQGLDHAQHLYRRLYYSGHLLPILATVATSVLTQMYTTTSGVNAPSARRVRLGYLSSPISDFGIVKGSVMVTPSDHLVFRKMSNGNIIQRQHPQDHYWLYFTTVKGEELSLDCGMFTFNMSQVVDTGPYLPSRMPAYPESKAGPFAPVMFESRLSQKTTPNFYTERKRLSILRYPKLQEAVTLFAQSSEPAETDGVIVSDSELMPFFDYMEALSERKLREVEKSIYKQLAPLHCLSMHNILCHQEWKKFPNSPPTTLQSDPQGEMIDLGLMQSMLSSLNF